MGHILETGCLIAGILFLLYYAGVVSYAGLSASFAWFWLLSGIVLVLMRFALHFQSLHPGSPLRFVTGPVLVLMAVGLAAVLMTGSRVVLAMRTKESSEDPSYAIVLGAQVKGTSPSRALKRRLERAVRYAGEHPDTVLILSGGQGADEGISEAECMRRYLIAAGISEDRIIPEDQSASTLENLRFSAEIILTDTGGPSAGQASDGELSETVAVISSDFHIYRALLLAGQAGYRKAVGIPAPSDTRMLPYNIMREICAILVSRVTGVL